MHQITAQSLDIKLRQVVEVPLFTKFLDPQLDPRHNNCLLWSLCDTEQSTKEKVEILMLKHEEELPVVTAKYLGSFKANSGFLHIFVSRESDHPMVKIA